MTDDAGASGLRAVAQENAARRAAAAANNTDNEVQLKIPKGETVTVRFLEDGKQLDRQWAYFHEMPPRGKQKWGDPVPCLDPKAVDPTARCPGCEKGLDRSIIGYINVIWRDGPVYAKTTVDGRERLDFSKVESRADVLAVWERGISTLTDLDELDVKWKGLPSRDADISRNTLDGFDTKYTIGVHLDGEGNSVATPMSEADQKLAEGKPDLTERVKPPTYEAMEALISGRSLGTSAQTETEANDADALAAAFSRSADTTPFNK